MFAWKPFLGYMGVVLQVSQGYSMLSWVIPSRVVSEKLNQHSIVEIAVKLLPKNLKMLKCEDPSIGLHLHFIFKKFQTLHWSNSSFAGNLAQCPFSTHKSFFWWFLFKFAGNLQIFWQWVWLCFYMIFYDAEICGQRNLFGKILGSWLLHWIFLYQDRMKGSW